MIEHDKGSVDKTGIASRIAELSRHLGMVPSEDTVTVNEPGTQGAMPLSKWLSDTRNSFLKLSTLLDKSLKLNLQ